MLKIARKTNGREKLKLGVKSYWKQFHFFSFSKLFRKIFLIIGILISMEFFDQSISSESFKDYYLITNEEQPIIYTERELGNLEKEIVWQVSDYIKKHGSKSKISPDSLVKICNEHNFNITFVLAQGQVESHFGTRGVAARTHSIFNVGAYDNGTILYKYDDPNKSIEPYIVLLKEKYLVGDKTIEDLMCKDGYVNYKGKRYASYRYYEQRLKNLYNHIQETTPIDSLQDVYLRSVIITELIAKNNF